MSAPTACQRWDCCSCIPPGLTSSKTVSVFPVGMCPQSRAHIHIDVADCTDHRARTWTQHQRPHPAHLSEWAGCMSTSESSEHPYPHMRDPSSGSAQALKPSQWLALDPRLCSCCHLDTGWPSRVVFGLPLLPLSVCALCGWADELLIIT